MIQYVNIKVKVNFIPIILLYSQIHSLYLTQQFHLQYNCYALKDKSVIYLL